MKNDPVLLRPLDEVRWSPCFGFSPYQDATVHEIRLLPVNKPLDDGMLLDSVKWSEVNCREVVVIFKKSMGRTHWAYGHQLEQPEARRLKMTNEAYFAFVKDQDELAREEAQRTTQDEADARDVASTETFMSRRHRLSLS